MPITDATSPYCQALAQAICDGQEAAITALWPLARPALADHIGVMVAAIAMDRRDVVAQALPFMDLCTTGGRLIQAALIHDRADLVPQLLPPSGRRMDDYPGHLVCTAIERGHLEAAVALWPYAEQDEHRQAVEVAAAVWGKGPSLERIRALALIALADAEWVNLEVFRGACRGGHAALARACLSQGLTTYQHTSTLVHAAFSPPSAAVAPTVLHALLDEMPPEGYAALIHTVTVTEPKHRRLLNLQPRDPHQGADGLAMYSPPALREAWIQAVGLNHLPRTRAMLRQAEVADVPASASRPRHRP